MTGLNIAIAAPEALFSVEIWGDRAAVAQRLAAGFGALPAPCRSVSHQEARILWWEPDTWLVRTLKSQRDETSDRLIEVLAADGAATDLSGAFIRIRIEGPLWRDLMMIGGVFDAESPHFAPGCVAGTVIHHLPVRLDVISESAVDAYVAPSYAPDLLHHWNLVAARVRAA